MSNKLLLTTKLDQRLLMNQQLKQVITLLQVTTLELKQQVEQWIETNPLIEVKEEVEEEDEIIYQHHEKTRHHSTESDYDMLENVAANETLRNFLLKQTLDCGWNDRAFMTAELIIDAIDEDGYLSMSTQEIYESICQQIETDEAEIISILKTIQTFEPAGVGARNTKECLLIQLEQKENRDESWIGAKKILSLENFEMSNLNLKSMIKATNMDEKELTNAFQLIKTLNLSPGKTFSGLKEQTIEPEIVVRKVQGEWRVELANSLMSRIDINKEYQGIIKKHARDKTFKTISTQLQEAKLLVNGLKRRNETLLAVAKYIVAHQGDFFDEGAFEMRPMNLIDVASALNYHESTISRITTGKYMATPRGLFELKYFFPGQLKTVQGRARSSIAVKAIIKQMVSKETTVYSDDEITKRLNEEGITISRRTVTKYREAMNIPSSYERANTKWMNNDVEPMDDKEGLE